MVFCVLLNILCIIILDKNKPAKFIKNGTVLKSYCRNRKIEDRPYIKGNNKIVNYNIWGSDERI